MKRADIFPTLNKEILPLLVIDPNGPVAQEVDLSSTNTHSDEIVTLGGSCVDVEFIRVQQKYCLL